MYSRLLAKYPLTTKCVTSGLIFSLGDILTQKMVQKKQNIDWRRNVNLILTGTFYLGPCLHVWYSKVLPQIVNRIIRTPTNKFVPAATGMAFDQLAFAPAFLTGFFIFLGVVSDPSVQGFNKGVQNFRQKIYDTMITNWKIWPAATLVNLMYVPIHYRVLFANFIGLFWNMYLSYMSNK